MITSNEAVSPASTRRTISSSDGGSVAGSERSSNGAACSANMGVGFRRPSGTAKGQPPFVPKGRHLTKCEGAHRHDQVADGDVDVSGGNQCCGDHDQPRHDDVSTQPGEL